MRYAILFALAVGLTPLAAVAAEAVDASRFVLLPEKGDPTISFRLWFPAGSEFDPPGKEGLAALTAKMLAEGSTQKRSYAEMLDKLFPLAAGYSGRASVEMAIIAGRVHRDNLEAFYPLLIEALVEPGFREEDFTRLKTQAINAIETSLRYGSDEELGKAVLYQEIFAGTRYAHPAVGLVESLRGITLDDVRSFYRKHYTRSAVVVGLGGGYEPALVERLGRDLAALPDGPAPEPPAIDPRPIQGRQVTLVEKKTAPATSIHLGYPIPLVRGSKDWYALAVANCWLGHHRNSIGRLYQTIREARGLNYGDYTYIERFPQGGERLVPPTNVCQRSQIFEMWIRPVPNETRHFALRAAIREFQNVIDRGLSEEEFATAREFLAKFVLHYAPTTMDRLGYALDDRFYEIKGSHLFRFRRVLNSLTREEVNAAIKKYWQADILRIVAITPDAESFRAALVADSPSPIQYPTPKSKNVMEEDKIIQTYGLKIKAENVRIVPAAELFEK